MAADLPPVIGDREALVTVLVNLLDNAHKYTGDDKHVVLRASASGEQVCLEVQDNGIGIPRRAMRKVFDRFYQVDQSLARKTGGCGLGLSIVRFIIEAHEGTIEVDSQVGKGSVFTVRLPASPRSRQQESQGGPPSCRP
jgi:signal transduction histidine kinase